MPANRQLVMLCRGVYKFVVVSRAKQGSTRCLRLVNPLFRAGLRFMNLQSWPIGLYLQLREVATRSPAVFHCPPPRACFLAFHTARLLLSLAVLGAARAMEGSTVAAASA